MATLFGMIGFSLIAGSSFAAHSSTCNLNDFSLVVENFEHSPHVKVNCCGYSLLFPHIESVARRLSILTALIREKNATNSSKSPSSTSVLVTCEAGGGW